VRFLQQHADALVDLAGAPLPVLEMLAGTEVTYLSAPAPRAGFGRYTQMVDALGLRRAIVDQPVSGADLRAFALRHLHSVAADTLAHLGPPQRMALWAEPRWLGCPLSRTAPSVRARFAVYRAIAERDARGMLRQARALLEAPPSRDPEWARFLLTTAVLGAQASGQAEEARRLWQLHAPTLIPGGAKPHERYVADWRN
jgi:hypothetical protein